MNPSHLASEETSVWSLRVQTLKAIFLILKAQWLIRRSPMADWRGSLGNLIEVNALVGSRAIPAIELSHATAQARRVDRAAKRLPVEPKCLPQAMALQWMLASTGSPSRLIIAMQKEAVGETEQGANAFHAWVELGDQILIGWCDRTQFRTVLAFEHIPNGST